jgi:hypothetical protein
VDSEVVVKQRWEREQLMLGLARDSPDEEFAAGGLGALAVPPSVRIVVVPADPGSQCVPGLDPAAVIPQLATLPGGQRLPQLDQVRGTSSGYVRYPYSGDNGLWPSFAAVHWHGGVDLFLGNQGGQELAVPAGSRRPAPVKYVTIKKVSGAPDPAHISTSLVERQNLTIRMSMRRFTRLTNAFSRKLENLTAAVSLHFMWYNFGRPHQTLTKRAGGVKTTPAMAAGVADHVWSLYEIAALLDSNGGSN